MGGGGAFHLAAKYPDLWAAVAVAAPAPGPSVSQLEKMRRIPILVLQGDADRTVFPEGTRRTVAAMAQLGMQRLYIEIDNGDHIQFVSKSRETLSKALSFFNVVQTTPRAKGN